MRLSRREIPEQAGSRVVVNQGAAGSTTLKSAVLGKSHKVVGAILTLAANGTIKFQSAANDLSGAFDVAQYGGFVFDSDAPFFLCNANEDLVLTTTGGAAHGVVLVVTE